MKASDDRIIIPAGIGEEALQGPGRHSHRFGEVLGVAPLLGLHQQGLKVVSAVLLPLLASEGRDEEGMKLLKGRVHPLELRRIHHPHPPSKAFPNSSTILPYKPSL